MMQCPNCGKNNTPQASFCQHCGQPLASNVVPGKKSPTKFIVIGVLIVLIVGIGGFFGYRSINQSETAKVATSSASSSTKVSKKKETAKAKKSSTKVSSSSSSRAAASSTNVKVAESSATSSSQSSETTSSTLALPEPLFVAGRSSVWENVNDSSKLLIITGKSTVQTANYVSDSATMPTHIEYNYNIEDSTDNSLELRSDMGGYGGSITVSGDRIVWQNHETVNEYTLKYYNDK